MNGRSNWSSVPMWFPFRSFYLGCCFFILCCRCTCASHSAQELEHGEYSSFYYNSFGRAPGGTPEVLLHGHARAVNSTVRITHPREHSMGRIMYGKPVAFGRNPSFSTYFSFSVTPGIGKGEGLAFIIAPRYIRTELLDEYRLGVAPGVFAVEFDDSMGIHLGSLVPWKTSNVSIPKLVPTSGKKLQTWIEYSGNTKILDVRLIELGLPRPSRAFISYTVDLSSLIWQSAMFVGISSSTGNSTRAATLYSWSFRLKHLTPYRMHSEPLDPHQFLGAPRRPEVHSGRGYLPGIFTGLVVGAICGGIITLVMLIACTVFMNRLPVALVGFPVHPIDYGYEKGMVTGEEASGSVGIEKY